MSFDLITLGRVSMDLFSENIGAPFEQIESFETSVGGSPTNIAIGSSRLGLNVAAITAVGEDNTGDFVINYLKNEKVSTDFVPRKANTRTGMAVVGVQPPAQFPLVFYRDNASDIYLTIDDIEKAPIAESRALLLSGTALSRGTCRDATLHAADIASAASTIVFMDLDLRPDQWTHSRAYGLNVRPVFPSLNVLIGTEEEFFAALSSKPEPIMQGQSVKHKQELEALLKSLLATHPKLTLVVKRGADGVSILKHNLPDQNVAGFPVEVLNTVGAGDAFASGLIYGRLQDWDWHKSARLANACGALVVTRNGCARAFPYKEEIQSFIDDNGGY